jgi:hypothetical protein
MLKRLQHIRFSNSPVHQQGNELPITRCYWYAQVYGSRVPTNIGNDLILKRPCYLFT